MAAPGAGTYGLFGFIKMNEETSIQENIRLRVSHGRTRIFRNNVGAWRDHKTGRLVRYGLRKGSADLIGYSTIEITGDMVGQRLAVFTSIEVKQRGKRSTADQQQWLRIVEAAGGIAFVAHDPEEAERILSCRLGLP